MMRARSEPVLNATSGDRRQAGDRPGEAVAADDRTAPAHSEDALAEAFSRRHAADWRHVAHWGRWLGWTGTVWRIDETRAVRQLVRLVCREAALAVDRPREARRLASAATIAAVERIARSDPRHAASVDEWDPDPQSLNTPGGVIDLRTGSLRPHDRADRMTAIAGASPRGDCPAWRRFLAEITAGDRELIAYLGRVAGYCLTGLTVEHVLFFLHGDGGNGKSVFVNVLSAILGDYAATAPLDTFLPARGERHPTDLAGLRGARLVSVVETEAGRSWAESKLKAVTGGDTIKARFMRQDFFAFRPQFKLIVVGNHKPAIRSIDAAMRRRLHLVPFTVAIPPERRDLQLLDRLLAERDGILAWALDGLAQWQRVGLAPPPAVTRASRDYFEEEDAVGDWLAERCVLDAGAFTSSTALFVDWKVWAEMSGEPVQTKNRLGRELNRRGFAADRANGCRGFRGLRLKPPAPGPESAESAETGR